MSDEFGDDRIVGNLVRTDRMNSGGGETGVEALAYSPPDRELDEIWCVEFGELHARAGRQRSDRAALGDVAAAGLATLAG